MSLIKISRGELVSTCRAPNISCVSNIIKPTPHYARLIVSDAPIIVCAEEMRDFMLKYSNDMVEIRRMILYLFPSICQCCGNKHRMVPNIG